MTKGLILTFILFGINTMLIAQTIESSDLYMTWEKNLTWLTATKSLTKEEQLNAINDRLFKPDRPNYSRTTTMYLPLLIIDGIPISIPDSLSRKSHEKITRLLNTQNIKDIQILDKQPDQWIFDRPFSGIIIITAVDKKTGNKIHKVKLE